MSMIDNMLARISHFKTFISISLNLEVRLYKYEQAELENVIGVELQ